MIIYNTTWLDNLLIREKVYAAAHAGEISAEEVRHIEKVYPVGFYSPNIIIRAGIFLLTTVIISFSFGLTAMIFSPKDEYIPVWCIIWAIITYRILEVKVKKKHHFRAGTDDALLWISGGFLLTGFLSLTEHTFDSYHPVVYHLVTAGSIFLLGLYLTLRFADRLMAILCALSLLAFFALIWNNTGALGSTTLPFFIMVLAVAGYYLAKRSQNNDKNLYYLHCLVPMQPLGLIILYLAGNYYAVEQLGNRLYSVNGGYQVPLPYFFWIWTATIPVLYVFLGSRQKDRILLRTGLVLLAVTGFTFRFYFHRMPAEILMTILGTMILGLSYALIRLLKTPKNGFTYEDQDDDGSAENPKIESLIISAIPTDAGSGASSRFGGGSFGGGGSSSNF